MGMHPDRSGIQDGVEEFRAQSAARHYLSPSGARQLFGRFLAPRANSDDGPGACQRERCRSRRTTRAKDQDSAPSDAKFFLQSAQHADVIGVAAIERPIAPYHHGIRGADLCGQRLAFLQMLENRLLVRQGHAETTDSRLGNGREKITESMNQEWEIDRVNATRGETSVVQQRRKRMPDRIANHAVRTRPACQWMRAIKMLHLSKANLPGRRGLGNGRVGQRASFPQRQDSRGQAYFTHRHGNEVFGMPGQTKEPNTVSDAPRFCGNLYRIDLAVHRRVYL